MAKTFRVITPDGHEAQAQQLATFTETVQGETFRFVVTKFPRFPVMVTHRSSTKSVCEVTTHDIIASAHDYKVAAVSALRRLIAEKGAARVRSVLAAAEAK